MLDVVAKLRGLALKGVDWAMRDYLDRLGARVPDKLELSGEDGAPLPAATVVANPLDPSTMTSEQVRKKLEEIRAEREELLRHPPAAPAQAETASEEEAPGDAPADDDGPGPDST